MVCSSYGSSDILSGGGWTVEFAPEFEPEYSAFPTEIQDELLAQVRILRLFGPALGRPRVDTLKGSKHANLKELRFNAGQGVWRVAFAFDPRRRAILLVAGNKAGVSGRRFYGDLIRVADERFAVHLRRIQSKAR
jgi:hypothetical protein